LLDISFKIGIIASFILNFWPIFNWISEFGLYFMIESIGTENKRDKEDMLSFAITI
jgi:hypothetical protein